MFVRLKFMLMRKILVFAVFVFAVFCVVPVHAQFKFGLKAGVEFSDLSVDDAFESTNGMGFFIGPTVKVKLPLGGLGVDASVLYDWYEAEIEDVANSDRRINEQHINIPVNLRYAFGLGETASFFIYAGPQVGFSIGNRHQGFFDGLAEWNTRSSVFSVNAGLGFEFFSRMQFGFNYNIVCGSSAELKVFEDRQWNTYDARANMWQVSLAYYL